MSLKRRLSILGLLIAVAVGIWFKFFRSRGESDRLLASGTVEATQAELGFAAGGRIVEILVHEGDSVKAGSVLARLDAGEAEARHQQMKAQVAVARAQLEELERGNRSEEIEQGRSALAGADRSLADAATELQRTETLAADSVVSRQSLDKARVTYDLAKSHDDQARLQLALLESGPRQERITAQRAQLAVAEAQVHSIEAALVNYDLRSEFDGIVTVRHREPGETVGPGAPVVSVMNPADRWVRIYIPENRIGATRIGQAATIRADSFRDQSYQGVVSFIAHEAEFTPRNIQTTEERVKLVYGVKVRITGDPAFELKPGTPADVELRDCGIVGLRDCGIEP